MKGSLSVTKEIRVDSVQDAPADVIVKNDSDGLYFEAEFSDLPSSILLSKNDGVIDEAIEIWRSLTGSITDKVRKLFRELVKDHTERLAHSITRNVVTQLTQLDPAMVSGVLETALSLSDKEKSDDGWLPYIGPRGGQGWRHTDGETVSYDDEPPGDVVTDQLSSEEKREIRQNFDEAGQDADRILYEEGETVPLEDRYEGEEIMYNGRSGWTEYKITDLRVDSPGPDVVVENKYGEAVSVTREEYEQAANPVGSVPEYLTEDLGRVQEGKVVRIEGWEQVAPNPDSVERTTIESVDGNLIQTKQGSFLADDEHGLMVEWDSVVEGDTYIHPEHGEITYTGESGERGYDDYEFETEDGETVYVQFSNAGEAVYSSVEMSLSEPEVMLDEFDEDRREQIESTADAILENHSIGVKQILDDGTAFVAGAKDSVAYYTPSTGDVAFNSDKVDEENLQKKYLKGYESGFLAGGSIQHVVCHELMHALHAQEGDEPDADTWQEYPDQDLIEEQLGEYAASSPAELVAEVGALLLQGEDVESEMPDVYESYIEYGGVPQEEITPI